MRRIFWVLYKSLLTVMSITWVIIIATTDFNKSQPRDVLTTAIVVIALAGTSLLASILSLVSITWKQNIQHVQSAWLNAIAAWTVLTILNALHRNATELHLLKTVNILMYQILGLIIWTRTFNIKFVAKK